MWEEGFKFPLPSKSGLTNNNNQRRSMYVNKSRFIKQEPTLEEESSDRNYR